MMCQNCMANHHKPRDIAALVVLLLVSTTHCVINSIVLIIRCIIIGQGISALLKAVFQIAQIPGDAFVGSCPYGDVANCP